MKSDFDWSEGFRSNDASVLKAFYEEHFPSVRSYVLQNSGSNDDAKDIFQEALMVTWMNLREEKVKDLTNLEGYVFRIAKNKWLDRVRSAGFKKELNIVTDNAEHTEENGVDIEARMEHLERIYCQLDGRCKKVLDMFYYQKKDLESIARELKVDLGSMRTIKYRCMMKLRKYHLEDRVNTDETL